MLRSGVTRSCALPPFSLLRTGPAASSTSANPYSTFPAAAAGTPIFTVRSKQLPTTTTTTTTARPSSSSPAAVILRAAVPTTTRRHASTSRDHDADAQAAARAAAAAARSDDLPPLDWNAFFKLRKTRRRWQVAFSITMSLASGAGGAVVLSTGVADGLTNQIPLDPVLTLGLFTFGFVALGWLAGPSLGSAVFYLINRKYKVPMTVVSTYYPQPEDWILDERRVEGVYALGTGR